MVSKYKEGDILTGPPRLVDGETVGQYKITTDECLCKVVKILASRVDGHDINVEIIAHKNPARVGGIHGVDSKKMLKTSERFWRMKNGMPKL